MVVTKALVNARACYRALSQKPSLNQVQSTSPWTNSKYARLSASFSKMSILKRIRQEQNKIKSYLKMRQFSNSLRSQRTTFKRSSTTATWVCRTTWVGSFTPALLSRDRHQTPCSFWIKATTKWRETPQPFATKMKASRWRRHSNRRSLTYSLSQVVKTKSHKSFSLTRSSKSMPRT